MTATKRDIEYNPSEESPYVFAAQYPGSCSSCTMLFEAGDQVFYREGELVAAHGCQYIDHDYLPDSNGIDFGPFVHGLEPGIAVIPRNRSKTDMCQSCFQIPASNGSCGCT